MTTVALIQSSDSSGTDNKPIPASPPSFFMPHSHKTSQGHPLSRTAQVSALNQLLAAPEQVASHSRPRTHASHKPLTPTPPKSSPVSPLAFPGPSPVEVTGLHSDDNVFTNPLHSPQNFDAAAHSLNRKYVVSKLPISDGAGDSRECVTLLDQDVRALLGDVTPSPSSPRIPTSAMSGDSFVIQPVGGDRGLGMGLFARKKMAGNSVVAIEQPVLLVPLVMGVSGSVEDTLERLISSLAPEDESVIRKLRQRLASDSWESVLRTHAFAVPLRVSSVPHGELPPHRAFFIHSSRVNHSCTPNAYWTWDASNLVLQMITARDVEEGEEIKISYVDPFLSTQDRGSILRNVYGFTCGSECGACTHSSSDAARNELFSLLSPGRGPTFEEWITTSSLPADHIIKIQQRCMNLRAQEGLELNGMMKHADAIAMCYGALGHKEMFRAWVFQGIKYRALLPFTDSGMKEKGLDDERILMELWIEEPERFPVWGMRIPQPALSRPRANSRSNNGHVRNQSSYDAARKSRRGSQSLTAADLLGRGKENRPGY